MKNTKLLLFFLPMLFGSIIISAQTDNWCGSTKDLAVKFQQNPLLEQQFHAYMTQAQQPDNSRAAATIYIPVVFHIVHDGNAIGNGENITDAQCISQIDALNKFYNYGDPNIANVPAVFKNLVANCNIHFCLAKFDPDGNPTSGIIRHQMTQATWNTETDIDNTLKPATIWDRTRYLNIWSVAMGGTGAGTLLGDGVLAYATLPYFATASDDGIAARYNTIGTTGNLLTGYNKGKTIVHESGHYFGLLHTWGLDGNCGDAGDYIADTPDQADLNFGCPTFPRISCTPSTNGDMFMNYMDYTNDACSAMFTLDQANVMHNNLNGLRSGLKTASTQCFYSLDAAITKLILPKDTVCSLNFSPAVIIQNAGSTTITTGKIYIQIDGGAPQTINWTGSLTVLEQIQLNLPVQTVTNGSHTFTVTFTEINNNSGDDFLSNNSLSTTFYAYEGVAGSPVPVTHNFETALLPTNWSILNTNNDNTWVLSSTVGGYSNSSQSAFINNKGYASNPNFNKKDALITDVYDLSVVPKPELKFDVAYAAFSTTRLDSLNVYYSLDCGSSWTKVWGQRGNEFATAAAQSAAFVPKDTQWRTVSIPLLQISGQAKVSFKFENVSGWGNAMYLDNINLQNNAALAIQEIHKAAVKIFPNPASGLLALRLPSTHDFHKISLFNNLGELVYESAITDDAIILSVNHLANGLYFIHLNGFTSSQTEKVLIQHP